MYSILLVGGFIFFILSFVLVINKVKSNKLSVATGVALLVLLIAFFTLNYFVLTGLHGMH